MILRRCLVSLAVIPLMLSARTLLAFSTGISGYSGRFEVICNQCHSGGQAPAVSFSGPSALAPGATGTFTFTVHSNAPSTQTAAGLDVAASSGTLQVIARQGTQLTFAEITHSEPKPNTENGEASWDFKWKAPTAPGTYVLWGAGNSVNQNRQASGDNPAATMFLVAVGGVASVTPTTTRSASPSPIPSETPSPTFTAPSPTNTSAPTETPIATPTDTPTATTVPTHTATETGTPTETATPTDTPTETETPTDTPTSTPTATATPIARSGDGNCDERITAADLPTLLLQLFSGEQPSCGADANGDGTVDDADISATINLLFRL